MGKWKRCAQLCLVLAAITVARLVAHLSLLWTQYLANVLPARGPAPFWAYARPVLVWYGGICLAALLLCAFFWHKGRKTGDVEGMAPDKWKRRAWSCLAMAAITLGAFAVHMLDCRVQYMVGISQGWPAPFWVYALPLAVGYGAGALALLALGFAFRRQARREADLPNKIDG